jgi:hypothetical protein
VSKTSPPELVKWLLWVRLVTADTAPSKKATTSIVKKSVLAGELIELTATVTPPTVIGVAVLKLTDSAHAITTEFILEPVRATLSTPVTSPWTTVAPMGAVIVVAEIVNV